MSRVLVVGPAGGDTHDGDKHPERPARIGAVMEGVADVAAEMGSDLIVVPSEPASRAALERIHTAEYLTRLEVYCATGGGPIDPDTFAKPDSWNAAVLAAGGGVRAVDLLRSGEADVAFVATRPPGHHAFADRSMGFCLLNNVAITAAALVEEGERVLIVDWDVHHGNGTQGVFWNDPNVLYVSTHQWPFYPGTGEADEVGGAGAVGSTVNVPVPAGATGDVLWRGIDEVAGPVIDEFAPTWVLISAGFDAHRADPLGDLALAGGDYADLARTVSSFAPGPGRLAVILEGGYDLEALRSSVRSMLGALGGIVGDGPIGGMAGEPATSGGPGADDIAALGVQRARALERQLG